MRRYTHVRNVATETKCNAVADALPIALQKQPRAVRSRFMALQSRSWTMEIFVAEFHSMIFTVEATAIHTAIFYHYHYIWPLYKMAAISVQRFNVHLVKFRMVYGHLFYRIHNVIRHKSILLFIAFSCRWKYRSVLTFSAVCFAILLCVLTENAAFLLRRNTFEALVDSVYAANCSGVM